MLSQLLERYEDQSLDQDLNQFIQLIIAHKIPLPGNSDEMMALLEVFRYDRQQNRSIEDQVKNICEKLRVPMPASTTHGSPTVAHSSIEHKMDENDEFGPPLTWNEEDDLNVSQLPYRGLEVTQPAASSLDGRADEKEYDLKVPPLPYHGLEVIQPAASSLDERADEKEYDLKVPPLPYHGLEVTQSAASSPDGCDDDWNEEDDLTVPPLPYSGLEVIQPAASSLDECADDCKKEDDPNVPPLPYRGPEVIQPAASSPDELADDCKKEDDPNVDQCRRSTPPNPPPRPSLAARLASSSKAAITASKSNPQSVPWQTPIRRQQTRKQEEIWQAVLPTIIKSQATTSESIASTVELKLQEDEDPWGEEKPMAAAPTSNGPIQKSLDSNRLSKPAPVLHQTKEDQLNQQNADASTILSNEKSPGSMPSTSDASINLPRRRRFTGAAATSKLDAQCKNGLHN